MRREKITLRLDATYHLMVQAGQTVTRGQRLCEDPEPEAECICPVSGTVQSVQFDPEHHEFVISVSSTRTK
jgi:Na+-translocating ferredoxin:NAD+ oxidoreductase RnfC subunit